MLVERQDYVHYNKGALAMYALREAMGEERVNRALAKIFPAETVAKATRLEDLFSREDTTEIKYLMKRARRTGSATRS